MSKKFFKRHTPALDTKISILPKVSIPLFTAFLQSSIFVTSVFTKILLIPYCFSNWLQNSCVESLRAHKIKFAPCLAYTFAIPSPIPLLAPVISATLPSNFPIFFPPFYLKATIYFKYSIVSFDKNNLDSKLWSITIALTFNFFINFK